MRTSLELQADFGDGYVRGSEIAQYHFDMWQDARGAPFPWPRTSYDVGRFVDACVPMMHTMISLELAGDAYSAGVSPDDVIIPRSYIRGLEQGYRARLTQLLQGFIRRY